MSGQNDVDFLLASADQARAYISITSKLGPSEQLIRFINLDGKLGEELGLENFDSLDPQSQHEVLLTRLNPDLLESLALESLASNLQSFGFKVLMGAGVATLAAGATSLFPLSAVLMGITTAGWAAHFTGTLLARHEIPTKSNFYHSLNILKKRTEINAYLSEITPTDLNPSSWHKVEEILDNKQSKLNKLLSELDTVHESYPKVRREIPSRSGWTLENLKSTNDDYGKTVKKLKEVQKNHRVKTEKLASLVKNSKVPPDRNTATIINRYLKLAKSSYSDAKKVMGMTTYMFGDIEEFLELMKKHIKK